MTWKVPQRILSTPSLPIRLSGPQVGRDAGRTDVNQINELQILTEPLQTQPRLEIFFDRKAKNINTRTFGMYHKLAIRFSELSI